MAALGVTGCRTDTPEAGVGVQVADRTVSLADVDRTAEAICAASLRELQDAGRVVPMSGARAQAAAITADRLRAEELASAYGVPAGGEAYGALRLEAREAGIVPDELTDAFVDAASTAQLVQDVLGEVGRLDLAAQGTAPSEEQAVARGEELFRAHALEHEIRFDPRLGVAVVDGDVVRAASGTSVAVSEWASSGVEPGIDTSGDHLPDNQTCG